MKNLKHLLLLLLLSNSILSQTIHIIDKTTQNPINKVRISNGALHSRSYTNTKEGIDISYLRPIDTLSIQVLGYQTTRIAVKDLEKMNNTIEVTSLNCNLNEVIVSAIRGEESKTSATQQVKILKASELEFMNQQTTAETVQNSGSAYVQMSQLGGGSSILRGFEANKVLLLVDGVRMNNAIYRGGHLQNIITMDGSIVDKMEILFGSGSVIYGSDALGGAIHFYTKNPILADSSSNSIIKTNAYTRYSTANNGKTGHIDLNIGRKKIASLTSVTISDFGDLREGAYRRSKYATWGLRPYYVTNTNGKDTMMPNKNDNIQKQTAYKQYDMLEKILFQQDSNVKHLLNIQYSTSSNIPRYDRLTETSANGNLKSAQWYYGPQKRLFGTYNLNISKANNIYDMANIILGYQNIEESRHNRNFNSAKLNHRIEQLNILSLNTDFTKTLKDNHLHYGAEITSNQVNSKAKQENIYTGITTPLDTRYPDGGSTMKTASAYLTHYWQINKTIALNDGLRYSHTTLKSKFNSKTFFDFPYDEITQKSNSITGNLGIIITPDPNWQVTILGSTGYRTPNVDDLSKVFESAAGSIIVPNAKLKPENTYNGEIGVANNTNDIMDFSVNCYYTLYNNIITTQKGTFNGQDSIMYDGVFSEVITQENVNKGYIYGANGSININISPKISINSTLTYTYGRLKTDTTDYPLDHIPPLFGRSGINFKSQKFRGELFVLYNGWKRIKNYNMLGEDNQLYATIDGTPSWYIVSLKTAYNFNKSIQMQLALENIFDQNYRTFASGISGSGRNFTITLRGSF